MTGTAAPDIINVIYLATLLYVLRVATGLSVRTSVLAAAALGVVVLATCCSDLLSKVVLDYACAIGAVFVACNYLLDTQHLPQPPTIQWQRLALGLCRALAVGLATVLRKLARLLVVVSVVVFNALLWGAAIVALRILALVDPAYPAPRHARIVRIVLCTSAEFARSLASTSSTGRVDRVITVGASVACPLQDVIQSVSVQRRRPLWRRALWVASCILCLLVPTTFLATLTRSGLDALRGVSRRAIASGLDTAISLAKSAAAKFLNLAKRIRVRFVEAKCLLPVVTVPIGQTACDLTLNWFTMTRKALNSVNLRRARFPTDWLKVPLAKFGILGAIIQAKLSVLQCQLCSVVLLSFTRSLVAGLKLKCSLPAVVPSFVPICDLSCRWVKALQAAFQGVGVPHTLLPAIHLGTIAAQFNIPGVLAKTTALFRLVTGPVVTVKRPLPKAKRGNGLVATRVKRVLPVIVPLMVPAFEFNTRWVRMVHATFGVLGIPRSLLPTGYYGMIRTMETRLNMPGVLVQAILSGVVPLRPAGPSVFWRPLFTYTPVQPRVIASKAKCVFPLVMPSKTVVTVYNGACDTPTQLAYLDPLQPYSPNCVETMPLAAMSSEPACPLVVATRVRRVPFGPARPVVPVQPTSYSAHPQWVWEIRSAFVASQIPRTVLMIDGFRWIALRYLRVSGTLVELVVALGLGLTPAGTAAFAPVDAPAAALPAVELDSGSTLVADKHVPVVPQTPLDFLRIALRLTVKLIDGVSESSTTDSTVALDAPVKATQSVSVQLSGVRSLLKPAGSRVIAVKIKKRAPFGPVKPVAPVRPVRSIPPEWVAIRSVFGLPQTPRNLPTSGEFYWSARRYFGTPGTRIVLTIPDGLGFASSGSGISSEQLRIRFHSTATASIAAPASTTVDESDSRSALVADRHIRFAATQTLLIFLRIVHRLCHQETDYVTPLLESPLVLTFTANTDDVASLGAPVEPALLAPVQIPGPSGADEPSLPVDKPVRPRVIAIKVKQRVPFGPAKLVVPVRPVHSVSLEWVQQIFNVFCPPQVPRSLPTSHGLYWITLRYFGTAGALPHGVDSASTASLEQVYLRLRSAAFAHSGQRSSLVAGRRRVAAAQLLLVFLRLVLGFIENTDAALDLESPSVPTSKNGLVTDTPTFGIEHVSSSPSPASRVAEDLQADTSTEGELPVSSERKRKRHPRARGGKKVQASKTRKMERQALEAEKAVQRAEQNDGVDKNQAASSPTDAAIQNGNSDASGSNIGTGGSTRRRQPTRGRQTRRTEGKSEGASAQDGSSVQTQGGRRNRGTGADGLGAGAMRIANAHIRQAVGSQFVQLPPLRLGTPRTAATDEFAATA